MNKLFRIGILDTQTGRWQAEQVAALIKPSGYGIEIFPSENSDELERALINGSIDIALNQASGIPLDLPEDLESIAFTERLPVNDVMVSTDKETRITDDLVKVGVTSSLRFAFTKHYYPNALPVLEASPVACFEKLLKGIFDVLIISYDEAVVNDYDARITEQIETSYFVPVAGAGSIAVQCRKKLSFSQKETLQRWINHEETEDCIRAERTFLKNLPPFQTMLLFSYAHFEGPLITLKAGLISPDGKKLFKTKKSAVLGESRNLGKKVAAEVFRLITEQRLQVI